MERSEKTHEKLIMHCKTHPELQLQDIFKFLYQSSFGCEHMMSSVENVTAYIKDEYCHDVADGQAHVEPLDGAYSRVGLAYLDLGLSAETLGRLFFLSARKEDDGEAQLIKKLDAARELIKDGRLPFSLAEFDASVEKWETDGYPAIHHSDAFRKIYAPSYRVISNSFVAFLPLFAEIDKRLATGTLRVAIEGGSASGKTTLGKMLEEVYGCTVFHTDDFFLRPEQRTPERYAEIGGNIDRERFIEEVLVPLSESKIISYRRFDCSEMKFQAPVEIKPGKLTVIEGAYSMHPTFARHYDFSVFLDITADLQRERIYKRNSPQMAERFFNEWIPLEKIYFSATDVKKRCGMCIEINR